MDHHIYSAIVIIPAFSCSGQRIIFLASTQEWAGGPGRGSITSIEMTVILEKF